MQGQPGGGVRPTSGITTEKDAVEVWRSYFEALLGGQAEQDEADTCSEFETVQPTICGGDGRL